MAALQAFFRHCPACGRRFEVKLVGKTLASSERTSYTATNPGTSTNIRGAFAHSHFNGGEGLFTWDDHVKVTSNVRVTTTKDKFRLSYECKHCGHRWEEEQTKESPLNVKRQWE